MYLTEVDENGCVLVYRSGRQGFTHYVMGKIGRRQGRTRGLTYNVQSYEYKLHLEARVKNELRVNTCLVATQCVDIKTFVFISFGVNPSLKIFPPDR